MSDTLGYIISMRGKNTKCGSSTVLMREHWASTLDRVVVKKGMFLRLIETKEKVRDTGYGCKCVYRKRSTRIQAVQRHRSRRLALIDPLPTPAQDISSNKYA